MFALKKELNVGFSAALLRESDVKPEFSNDYLLFFFSKACSTSLGMDDRSIEDSQITASSNSANYLPNYGRLNNIKSVSMGGSWCAGTSDVSPYLQIDMKKKMTFSGIATQGAGDAQNWLTKFKIEKSDDGNSFTDHTEFGIAKVMISFWFQLALGDLTIFLSLSQKPTTVPLLKTQTVTGIDTLSNTKYQEIV